jgi:hypothetical protein
METIGESVQSSLLITQRVGKAEAWQSERQRTDKRQDISCVTREDINTGLHERDLIAPCFLQEAPREITSMTVASVKQTVKGWNVLYFVDCVE